MSNKFTHTCIAILLSIYLPAQDAQFTQFYSSPLYLNPAFTGLTIEHRVTATYRNQWPNISRGYKSYIASYDYNFSDINSGLGVYAMQDVAPSFRLTKTLIGINYAYSIELDEKSNLRGGINLSMGQQKIDNTSLIFNDQLITGSAASTDGGSAQRIIYPDAGAGVLYTAKSLWLGMSIKHLTRPDVSLTGAASRLSMYMNVHGGYRYIFTNSSPGTSKMEEYIIGCFNYRHQGANDQFDIGAYYYKSMINIGLWYRGLPFKRLPGFSNNESIALLVGFEIPDDGVRVCYSYDYTLSSMKLSTTKGGHEVSLVYEIADKAKRNKRAGVSYPKF